RTAVCERHAVRTAAAARPVPANARRGRCAAPNAPDDRRRPPDPSRGAHAPRRSEEAGVRVRRAVRHAGGGRGAARLRLLADGACADRRAENPNVLVVGVASGPNNLDPRIGTDDVSAKAAQIIFNSLLTLDERLHVAPDLAERLENPDPLTYVVRLRRG